MKKGMFLFGMIFSAVNLSASCGLCVCDVHQRMGNMGWTVETRASRTTYDLDGAKGFYVQTVVVTEYSGVPDWRWGGTLSLVSNFPERNHHKTGFGNPLLRGERSWGGWAVGSLLELPGGDDAHGLASDHVAAIPYVSWRGGDCGWQADLRLGYSHSFSGKGAHDVGSTETHPHASLVVNPHEDREVVYRAGLRRVFGRINGGAFFEGQQVLAGETKGKGFLTTGLTVDVSCPRGWSAGIEVEGPIVRPHRLDNRLGVRVSKSF